MLKCLEAFIVINNVEKHAINLDDPSYNNLREVEVLTNLTQETMSLHNLLSLARLPTR
jgi:hypothetical protein